MMVLDNLIERYAAGATSLRPSIAGLAHDELTAFPVPDAWSIQQIVFHIVDSDLVDTDRMKRVVAEPNPPTLIGYDESAFARRLFYQQLDAQRACELFENNRLLMADILRRLPANCFGRIGHHNERGDMTLADVLTDAVQHMEHHLKFIHEKRKLLGKPIE